MIEDIKKDADARMHKSVEALKNELSKVRTGRAHTSLLDHIMVPYYGSDVPLQQVANVAVGDARMLTVTVWEKNVASVVEKAIRDSNLGLNPTGAGEVIRVPLPPLTEERRKDMIKLVKAEAENARIAIRNIRRDANSDFKDLLKDKEISEDEEHKAEDDIQKLTNKYVALVDDVLVAKEKDLMEI